MLRFIVTLQVLFITLLLILSYKNLVSTPILGAKSEQSDKVVYIDDFNLKYPSSWNIIENKDYVKLKSPDSTSYINILLSTESIQEIENIINCSTCNTKVINNITFNEKISSDAQIYETVVGTSIYNFEIPISDSLSNEVFYTITRNDR